jgi:hypothetical protein
MIKARMRGGTSWHDVCILNLSVHGLGIQAPEPPARGTYVEICRGNCMIIARVVWTKGHRAGLRTQDAIFIPAVVNARAVATQAAAGRPVERQRARRTVLEKHDSSRLAGRAMEFACFALVAGAMAMMAFGTVEQALAQPLSKISSAVGEP